MILKLLIFFQMIISAISDVTLYKYKTSQTISINSNKLRETIDSRYFAYPGFHNLDNKLNYTTSYFNTNKYYFGTNILKDYIITKPTIIGNIKYNSNNKHIFNYVINVVLSHQGTIILYHNNNPVITFNSKKVSHYDYLFLNKGLHIFNLEVNGNRICNCPSFKDGYQQTRYFFGWLSNTENKKNSTIILDKVKTQLNINKIKPLSFYLSITS